MTTVMTTPQRGSYRELQKGAAHVERLSVRGGWAQARASVDGDTTCEARMFFAIA